MVRTGSPRDGWRPLEPDAGMASGGSRYPLEAPMPGVRASLALCCGLVQAAGCSVAQDGPLRVACVGDSITFGAGVEPRERSCYPALLGELLGDRYDVRNFGVSGSTLLCTGDTPYVEQAAFQNALEFLPHLVVICLGTNDTKPWNWEGRDRFVADYCALIDAFAVLPTAPRIIVCLPVPAFGEAFGISGDRVEAEVLPLVRQVAYEAGVELVDLHTPLRHHPEYFPDRVHPDAFGAEAMSRRIFEVVQFEAAGRTVELPGSVRVTGTTSFCGYEQANFTFEGRDCHLVRPRRAAEGLPWLWRARFFGWEPQADAYLLERGFHILYCDVAGLYGSPPAVAIWDRFYEFTQRIGLHPKPILAGVSRGGLIVYNWAAKWPGRVSAIYCYAPVMDIRSWPLGLGTGPGNVNDREPCLRAYGLTEAPGADFPLTPLNLLAPLAAARVPIVHYVGLADTDVPVVENTAIAAQRYADLGGHMEVIGIEGMGHHPATYGTDDPTPVVDFLLRAVGRKPNYAALPVPSVEFRGEMAGWGGGTWWDQFAALNALARTHGADIDLLFLGDSITQGWTGAEERRAVSGGDRLFDRLYARYGAASFGLSGDRTQNVLYRIHHGNLAGMSPRLIVLMIGANNLGGDGSTGDEVAEGTVAIVEAIESQCPDARVLLLGCLPKGHDPDTPVRAQIDRLHERLADVADGERVYYLDIRDRFVNPDGTASAVTMAADAVHLTAAGYEAWGDAIAPMIRELMGA